MLILTALLANLAVMVINLARDLMIWVKRIVANAPSIGKKRAA